MASLQGRAVVLNAFNPPFDTRAARGFGRPEISLVAGDTLSNIRAFQSICAPADDTDYIRAQKRRKASSGGDVAIHRVGTEDTKSIVLVRVSLDLVSCLNAFGMP